MTCQITVLHPSETVLFAASELARYLRLMSATPVDTKITVAAKPQSGSISLGLLGQSLPTCAHKLDDAQQDDAILIDVKNGAGFIGGVNDRSVLLGVYRFLNKLGCRWVRPGVDGELIPRVNLSSASVTLDEKASLRHRVICIEGSVSFENVLNIIDWAPKAGFSGYFMQFPDGFIFFQRWYAHLQDNTRKAEPFSKEMARAFTITLEQEIRKRSLAYQGVGHGWTCKALGLDVSHWDPFYAPLPDGAAEMIALRNGKREYAWDRPMITSLCYSRADVRQRMIQEITDYAVAHPEVDALHVWLDDGGSCCECPECSKQPPANVYVQMLSDLDKALTAKNSPMRIIFIAYTSLLWAPENSPVKLDPRRFSFVYANARGDYRKALRVPDRKDLKTPAFVPNKSVMKRDNDEFCAFLQSWQKYFDGDSMLFEYHFGPWLNTLDQYVLARVIHDDIRTLKPLGFNGLITCQSQRVFFPTGLPEYIMGQTLWNDEANYDALMDDYFYACFGNGSAQCKEFIKVAGEQVGRIFEPAGTLMLKKDAARQILRLEMMLADFQKTIDENAARTNLCQIRSWEYMNWYVNILGRLARVGTAMTRNDDAAVVNEWRVFREFLFKNEPHYQPGLDVASFAGMFDNYLVRGKFSTAPENVVQQ